MDQRSIHLKSISGKGIKCFLLFAKPSLYVAVSVAGADGRRKDQKKERLRTTADRTGGENPEWDHPIQIDLDSSDHDLVLQFDVMDQGRLGDRIVGVVRVPVVDLTAEEPAGASCRASYQVRTSNGKPNGVLSFLYKRSGGEVRIPPLDPVVGHSPPPSAPIYSPPNLDFYPPPASSSGFYPAIAASSSGFYPAIDPTVYDPPPPVPASVGYPPLPYPATYYPPPPAHSGYFSRLYPTIGYPAAVDGYYPQAAPVHVACYPPQDPYCCRMDDRHMDGCY